MNRRELLKFSLLSPLLGLFKKKEPPKEYLSPLAQMYRAMNKNDSLSRIPPTAGTSSNTEVVEFDYKFITPPEEKWFVLTENMYGRGNKEE